MLYDPEMWWLSIVALVGGIIFVAVGIFKGR